MSWYLDELRNCAWYEIYQYISYSTQSDHKVTEIILIIVLYFFVFSGIATEYLTTKRSWSNTRRWLIFRRLKIEYSRYLCSELDPLLCCLDVSNSTDYIVCPSDFTGHSSVSAYRSLEHLFINFCSTHYFFLGEAFQMSHLSQEAVHGSRSLNPLHASTQRDSWQSNANILHS